MIGNGPSLRIEDLDKLKSNSDVTIASNKIYLAFNDTEWRPSYYTVADLLVATQNDNEIKQLDLVKFFPDHFKSILGKTGNHDCNGSQLYYRMIPQKYDRNNNHIHGFSTNPLKGFHVGETVTNMNIQLAYYLGCNPIYLIGIDGTYSLPSKTKKHPVHNKVFVSEGEINHFSPAYRKEGEAWCIPKPHEHERAFRNSATFLKSKGVPIFNASRMSVVQAFERIDIDTIL